MPCCAKKYYYYCMVCVALSEQSRRRRLSCVVVWPTCKLLYNPTGIMGGMIAKWLISDEIARCNVAALVYVRATGSNAKYVILSACWSEATVTAPRRKSSWHGGTMYNKRYAHINEVSQKHRSLPTSLRSS